MSHTFVPLTRARPTQVMLRRRVPAAGGPCDAGTTQASRPSKAPIATGRDSKHHAHIVDSLRPRCRSILIHGPVPAGCPVIAAAHFSCDALAIQVI